MGTIREHQAASVAIRTKAGPKAAAAAPSPTASALCSSQTIRQSTCRQDGRRCTDQIGHIALRGADVCGYPHSVRDASVSRLITVWARRLCTKCAAEAATCEGWKVIEAPLPISLQAHLCTSQHTHSHRAQRARSGPPRPHAPGHCGSAYASVINALLQASRDAAQVTSRGQAQG